MTPDSTSREAAHDADLMEAGARRRAAYEERQAKAGGRQAAFRRLQAMGEPDFAHGVALYVEDISVSFDGFKALNALTLAVDVGELRCIIGPNGAGKTTMMDCITGKTRPDSGSVFFGSNIDLLRLTEPQIAQVGVGRKFQKPTVYEQLTRVREPRARAARPTAACAPRCSTAWAARSSTASARCWC